MASKLQLDPSDPGIAEVIAGATVGQEMILREVRIIPTSISETSFNADVVGLTVENESPEAEAAEEQYPSSDTGPSLEGMPMGQGYKQKSEYDSGTPA